MFPVFGEVPGYPLVFIVFWGAAVIFALAMARHLRVFAATRPAVEQPEPFGSIGARLSGLIEYALVQRKMFKDPRAGLMHAGIFWGFVLLTIGTANVVTGGIIETLLSAPLGGAIWTVISAMQNVVAVIVIGSIAWAFERRLISRPKRLTYNRDALLILAMIGGVVATELLAEVFEFARFGDQPGAFVSAALAGPLRAAVGPTGLELGFGALWWAHIVLVAAFLVYLPFSKHLHIATSFPNIWYRKLRPRGELPAMDLEREDATYGLKSLQDLGWKDLLDGFSFCECGRCQQGCRGLATG
jgi:nitrate reductase gamma subunit